LNLKEPIVSPERERLHFSQAKTHAPPNLARIPLRRT
jgi:hypothetical protein